jgi:hypothetical protein
MVFDISGQLKTLPQQGRICNLRSHVRVGAPRLRADADARLRPENGCKDAGSHAILPQEPAQKEMLMAQMRWPEPEKQAIWASQRTKK